MNSSSGIKLLIGIISILLLALSCKARRPSSNLAQVDRFYDQQYYTGVIQKIVKGVKFFGEVHVAASADGRYVAVSASEITGEDNFEDLERVEPLAVPKEGVKGLYILDAKTLRPVSDGSAKRLKFYGNRRAASSAGSSFNGVRKIAFSPDGKTVAACGKDGVAIWWDIKDMVSPPEFLPASNVGSCNTIDFGYTSQKNQYDILLLDYNVLAIGSNKGVFLNFLTKKEQSDGMPSRAICTAGPAQAVKFVGQVRNAQGKMVPNAAMLFVALGQNRPDAQLGLVERGERISVGARAAVLPTFGMHTKGFGLERTSFQRQFRDRVTCESVLKPLGSKLREPAAVAYNYPMLMLGSQRERNVRLYSKVDLNGLTPIDPHPDKLVNTEGEGIYAMDISDKYGFLDNTNFMFTSQSDRTGRIWKYNVDKSRGLDLLAQMNVSQGNKISSAAFLKDRPLLIMGDRGHAYVWDFAKMLRPQTVKSLTGRANYTAIAAQSDSQIVYLGDDKGVLRVFDYEVLKNNKPKSFNVFKSPISQILVSEDSRMSRYLVASGNQVAVGSAKEFFNQQNAPDKKYAVSPEKGRVVQWKFSTDARVIYGVTDKGLITGFDLEGGGEITYEYQVQGLQPGDLVSEFDPFPSEVEKMIHFHEGEEGFVEVHDLIQPIIDGQRQGMAALTPFNIFGTDEENKKAVKERAEASAETSEADLKAEADVKAEVDIKAEVDGNKPEEWYGDLMQAQPSAENPDLVAGSPQTPAQFNQQRTEDAKDCADGSCSTLDLRMAADKAESAPMNPRYRPPVVKSEKRNFNHIKVAVVTKQGRIFMVDLEADKSNAQIELFYRTVPVRPNSSYFSTYVSPTLKAGNQPQNYYQKNFKLTDNRLTRYRAKHIKFDQDGSGLFFVTQGGNQVRYLPLESSSGKNVVEIKAYGSIPEKKFFDPWVTFNVYDRTLAPMLQSSPAGIQGMGGAPKLQLSGYGRLLLSPDSNGGLTTFSLNRFAQSTYSKRKYLFNYYNQETRRANVKDFAVTNYGGFAFAIHADNSVKVHWVDQTLDLTTFGMMSEVFDALYKK